MRFLLLGLCLLSACQDPLDKPETHKHAPSFNGMVRSTAEHNHVELYVYRSGRIEVYLFDNPGNPVDTRDAAGFVEITLEDGRKEKVPVTYGAPDHHDLLQGQINKPFPTHFTALVDVTTNKGIRFLAKFDYDINKQRDKKPHMHDPRQGGQVAMLGDQHVELVRPSPGEYRVFLSDLSRGPLPPSLVKNPSIVVDPDAESPEVIPLTIDPTQTFLQASGNKNPKDPISIRVNLTLNEKPGLIDFLWTNPKKQGTGNGEQGTGQK